MNLSESVSLDFNGILSKRHRSVWEISAKLIIFCGICIEIASICVWCVKLTDKLCMHVRLESSACGAFDPILQNIAWLDLKMRYNEIKHHLYWWVRYTQKKKQFNRTHSSQLRLFRVDFVKSVRILCVNFFKTFPAWTFNRLPYFKELT